MTDDKHPSAKRRRRFRANELLGQLLDRGWCDEPMLVRELVISPAQLKAYCAGEVPMPLERQLCLALLLIDRVPAMARQGHALRAQVAAAAEFDAAETKRHVMPPAPRW